MGEGIGRSAPRPDGPDKVRGRFAFSNDVRSAEALVGLIVRSPHPAATLRSIDAEAARRLPGVHAVVTAADVPGRATFGLVRADQPVFASEVVRYQGEPVAAIAAVDRPSALAAAALLEVLYQPVAALTDPATARQAGPIHPDGNVFRDLTVRRGDADAHGEVVVEGTYEVGRQDQAMLAPEAGLAIPLPGGGVELHVATQSLHVDQAQVAASLGLPAEQVHLVLAGVGGAFGAREDLTLHLPACLLALRTGRPVRIAFTRAESFLGHPHRHPAQLWYRHEATADGRLVRVDARLLFDGGAYA